jgi:hypothetical protein
LRREENNFLSQEMLASIRSLLVKAVLGTDMANHSEQMTRLDVLIENLRDQEQNKQPSIPWYWPSKPPPNMKTDVEKETWAIKLQEGFVVELFLHAADIGSPAMPFEQFKKWNKLCQEEFFVQGEMEVKEFGHLISPAAGFDRAQPPISEHNFTNFFLNFLSKPLFHKLNDLSKIGFIEKKHDIILGESLSNIEQGVDPQNNNEGDEDERSEGELKRNVICGVNLNIQLENLQYNSDQWARIGKELKEQAEQAAKTTPPPPSPPVEVPKRSESPGSSPPKPTSSKMVNRANGATSPSQGQHTRSAAHSLFKSVAE